MNAGLGSMRAVVVDSKAHTRPCATANRLRCAQSDSRLAGFAAENRHAPCLEWRCTTSTSCKGAPALVPKHANLQQMRLVLERMYAASAGHPVPGVTGTGTSPLWLGHSRPDIDRFLVKVEDKPPRAPSKDKSACYYANVGDAIRTLREDIPLLFAKDLNYNIYRTDLVFRDPMNSFSGLESYKTVFWSLRFHGRLFFKALTVEVKRIWQPEDNVIKMRWTIVGAPRVPWQAVGVFDGVSEYKLDNDGKIYVHSVTNVQLRDPPIQIPALYGLNLVPSVQQQPCPGAWSSAEVEPLVVLQLQPWTRPLQSAWPSSAAAQRLALEGVGGGADH